MKRRAAPLSATLALLLAACASTPPPGGMPWTTGRLSLQVQAQAGRPAQNLSAAFELRGDGRSGELRLQSPLGLRMATARWAPGMALLDSGQGEQAYESLAALSQQALGEVLPLQALTHWLAGRPWPEAPATPSAGGFEQLGWQVSLARRSEGWIEAERMAPPVLRVRVKLDDPT